MKAIQTLSALVTLPVQAAYTLALTVFALISCLVVALLAIFLLVIFLLPIWFILSLL